MPTTHSPWRDEFDIPDDVAYLNCAYLGPMARATIAAGVAGLERKARPWEVVVDDFFEPVARLRAAIADLLGATPDGIALTPSVSYGVANAAANVGLGAGGRVLVLAGQFPSNVYPWREAADRVGATVHTVERPSHGGWADAVVAALDERVQVVAVPGCHWTDGTTVDLAAVRAASRGVGAALVVDGCQSFGASPFDVRVVEPDAAVGAGYKWLLGPYSQAFLYLAPHLRAGRPIEHNWINRADSEDFAGLVDYRDEFQPGARRFDVGEVSNFALVPAAIAAIEQVLAWGVDNIARHAKALTDLAAARAAGLGLTVAPPEQRSPHLLGVRLPSAMDPRAVAAGLAAAKVYVSVRGDAIRVSAHVFNTDAEVDRLFDVLAGLVDR